MYDAYFSWLVSKVYSSIYTRRNTYKKLLKHLHNTEYIYDDHFNDYNRFADGMDLRCRFAEETGNDSSLICKPCSVLEMMVALSIRCEEEYMADMDKGDRTGTWFWEMVTSLGLSCVTDDIYINRFVTERIDDFLYRRYSYDGNGGLFYIEGSQKDLRQMEIWSQMCWYLDSILRRKEN